MTYEEFKQQTESIPDNELYRIARNELKKLCETGGRSFNMTVPPQITDTDIIIAEVLRRFEILSFVTDGGVVPNVDPLKVIHKPPVMIYEHKDKPNPI